MSIKYVLDFFILLIKMIANSSANSLSQVDGGGELGFLLPVIVLMKLNSFLVSLPTSMFYEESMCVFALLTMAMYLFLSTLRAVH